MEQTGGTYEMPTGVWKTDSNRSDNAGQGLRLLLFHPSRFVFIDAADLAEDNGRFSGQFVTGGIGITNALHGSLDRSPLLAVPINDTNCNVNGFFSGAGHFDQAECIGFQTFAEI